MNYEPVLRLRNLHSYEINSGNEESDTNNICSTYSPEFINLGDGPVSPI